MPDGSNISFANGTLEDHQKLVENTATVLRSAHVSLNKNPNEKISIGKGDYGKGKYNDGAHEIAQFLGQMDLPDMKEKIEKRAAELEGKTIGPDGEESLTWTDKTVYAMHKFLQDSDITPEDKQNYARYLQEEINESKVVVKGDMVFDGNGLPIATMVPPQLTPKTADYNENGLNAYLNNANMKNIKMPWMAGLEPKKVPFNVLNQSEAQQDEPVAMNLSGLNTNPTGLKNTTFLPDEGLKDAPKTADWDNTQIPDVQSNPTEEETFYHNKRRMNVRLKEMYGIGSLLAKRSSRRNHAYRKMKKMINNPKIDHEAELLKKHSRKFGRAEGRAVTVALLDKMGVNHNISLRPQHLYAQLPESGQALRDQVEAYSRIDGFIVKKNDQKSIEANGENGALKLLAHKIVSNQLTIEEAIAIQLPKEAELKRQRELEAKGEDQKTSTTKALSPVDNSKILSDFDTELATFKNKSTLDGWWTRRRALDRGVDIKKLGDTSVDAQKNGRLLRDDMGSDAKFYAYLVYSGKMSESQAREMIQSEQNKKATVAKSNETQSAPAETEGKKPKFSKNRLTDPSFQPDADHEVYMMRKDGTQIAIAENDVVRDKNHNVTGLKPEAQDKYDLTGGEKSAPQKAEPATTTHACPVADVKSSPIANQISQELQGEREKSSSPKPETTKAEPIKFRSENTQSKKSPSAELQPDRVTHEFYEGKKPKATEKDKAITFQKNHRDLSKQLADSKARKRGRGRSRDRGLSLGR